jgi:Iap family predicted aminopeptidase
MKRISSLILKLPIALGLFYSCAESRRDVAMENKTEIEKEDIQRAFWTHDHLRSPEQKAIVQQAESFFYENIGFVNGRMELTIDRADVEKKGWPTLYYDIFKEELEPVNRYLDTLSFEAREKFIEAFVKPQEEYLARKKSLHAE